MHDARNLLPPPPPRRPRSGIGGSIGAQLRAAREASGRSVERVCGETRLSRQVLLALEADRLDEVGGEFYVRGFLRQLADAYGLDGEALVEAFDARRLPGQEPSPLPAVQTPSWLAEASTPGRGLGPAQLFFLIVAVATVVVFVLAAQRKRGPQVAARPAVSAPAQASAEGAPAEGGQPAPTARAIATARGAASSGAASSPRRGDEAADAATAPR